MLKRHQTMKLFFVIVLVLQLFSNSLLADNPPIQVSVEQAYNQAWKYFYKKIIITSIVDKVTIKNVKVNKGNCKVPTTTLNNRLKKVNMFPNSLGYGEELEVRLKKCSNVLRVDVITDQGEWTLER
jgi:hypothetical protein